jgi:hypothetical protein
MGRCWYCGILMTEPSMRSPTDWRFADLKTMKTRDHRNPSVRGGTDDDENIVHACFTCNCSKGKKTVDEYRLYLYLKSGAGRTRMYLRDALSQDVLPATMSESIKAAIHFLDENFPLPQFWGECNQEQECLNR